MIFKNKVEEYKNEFKSQADRVKSTDRFFEDKYYYGPGFGPKFNPPFVPGTIYSFIYNTDSKISQERKFINRNPFLLCTDYTRGDKGVVIIGIDLITVPPTERIEILSRIYDNYMNTIQQNEESLKKGGRQTPILLKSSILERLLRNTEYQKSLFGFKQQFITDVNIVEISDWCKIPYLKRSLIEGMSLDEIYREYKAKSNRSQ